MGDTTRRGYGGHHQRLRRRLLAEAIGKPCHYCGEPMLEGQALDLDHNDDRTAYRGMTHASCNRSAGARKRWQDAPTTVMPDGTVRIDNRTSIPVSVIEAAKARGEQYVPLPDGRYWNIESQIINSQQW
ncbi:endonuclease domain-containing protein [Streptomyces chiangmaiensis]|uniref:Endonuclease domain-containing protein n=1 Tax=Streptomyces chiangmaiensis TaxID=766497 RepID=A0ABU7FRS0_9ACTN|nr:endonuclease domain-containing protein [Streptomyces chiangmaiensis]MED7826805.1 endonuclease domain-containing protein [Streptomyces chiangmaiensis]